MENVLFVPSVADSEWVQGLKLGASAAELPVAGRRAIDYMLEFSRRYDVMFTEVIDWHFSQNLSDDFSEITRTGYPVFYVKGEGPVPKGLAEIECVSTPLTQPVQDGLVVAWGLFAILGEPGTPSLAPLSDEACAVTPPGIYRRVDGRWFREEIDVVVVKDVATWHRVNLDILHHPDRFTLPGYSAEENVHIGRSVVMEYGTKVKAPVLLCDNTWLARNVVLDGDVIVSTGSFIGEGTRLKNTFVGHDTYIGVGLDFENKIIMGNRVIDPETGAYMDIDEPGLARRILPGFGWLRKLWHFLRGRSHGRLG